MLINHEALIFWLCGTLTLFQPAMFSDILGKLVYPASEMFQACKKPDGPSAFSGRLFTVMARLTCFMSAAK
ncbi:hypothetical protein ACC674_37300, partial [Rhizobium ruizarguesonis]